MRYILLVIISFLSILLQATFFSFYTIKGTLPDLLLIFVVFFALLNGTREATIYGALCGLLEDLYAGRCLGMNALAKGLTAYIIARVQVTVFKENILVGIIGALLGTIINTAFMVIISAIAFRTLVLDVHLLLRILYQCIYNMMLSIPVYIWYYNSYRTGLLRTNR